MLSVDQHKGSACNKATPNVLPCRIQHDGPVSEVDSYWKPSQEPGICIPGMLADRFADYLQDGKRVAYFRGRKLHGKALRVPAGYQGVVVDKTDPPKPHVPGPDEPEVIDLEAEDEMPLGALETKAEFDEVVIWGHESVADTSSDPYVRGVEEWMKVAEKVRIVWDGDGELFNFTDMFRYIFTRKRTSELVLGDRPRLILRLCHAFPWPHYYLRNEATTSR